jgi:hypothetical protein
MIDLSLVWYNTIMKCIMIKSALSESSFELQKEGELAEDYGQNIKHWNGE